MDELSGRIKELLKDPESVARIMSIAKSFGEGSQEREVEKQEVQEEGAEDDMIAAVLKNPRLKKLFCTDCQRRNRLLTALCPYLSSEKSKKLQRILKATSAIETVFGAAELF